MQLMHCGRISHPSLLPDGAVPVAPSAVQPRGGTYTDEGMKPHVMPRALEPSEIRTIVDEFRQATARAFEAGFDGVDLHGGAGYLPMQFLSSSTNHRTDEYGGSVERRTRFILEVLEAMASVKGAQRIGVNLSPEMPFNDTSDDTPIDTYGYLVKTIGTMGLAYLHISPYGATDYHALLRPLFKGPYLAGGGFDQTKGEAFLNAGRAEAIVYGSMFIANPDLPERFRRGAPLAQADQATFYSGGANGYIDYPPLDEQG
jgi:N-ethylmaleimide reductase